MGVSTYPILEGRENIKDIPQEFWHVEWKWLTDVVDQLDDMTEDLDVTLLGDFSGYCREDAFRQGEDVEEMEAEATFQNGRYISAEGYQLWTPERVWCNPSDGLKTTHVLLKQLQTKPDSVDADKGDIEEFIYVLKELEKVLLEAQRDNKRFYLGGG